MKDNTNNTKRKLIGMLLVNTSQKNRPFDDHAGLVELQAINVWAKFHIQDIRSHQLLTKLEFTIKMRNKTVRNIVTTYSKLSV